MEDLEMSVELLSELVAKKKVKQLRTIFEEHNIVDLAEIVSKMNLDDAIFIIRILKNDLSGDLFTYLDNETQENVIKALANEEVKNVVGTLYSDEIYELLDEMPAEVVKKILKSVSAQDRADINRLLSYGANSAGSIMTTDYVELREEDDVTKAMAKIKSQGKLAETINYCFITNDYGVLCGVVSLRDILFAPDDEVIGELMDVDFLSVKTKDDQEDVIKLMSKYDVTLVAVVDESNRLVGCVTADDVIDVIETEATEDIHKMAGVAPLEGSYLETGVKEMSKSRIMWLLVLMITYTVSSLIMNANQDLLIAIPTLITFTPMLMDTAGNAGSQASAMVIRGITVDDLTTKDFFKVIMKEVGVALICGSVLFLVNTLRIWLFVKDCGLDIALTVSLSVFFVVIIAKLIGGILPLFALVIKQDPAAMASPLITTCVDSLTLIIYFSLARVVLKL